MSASAATLQPTTIKLGSEAIHPCESLQEVVITDLDQDLTPTMSQEEEVGTQDKAVCYQYSSTHYQEAVNAEWKRLKMEKTAERHSLPLAAGGDCAQGRNSSEHQCVSASGGGLLSSSAVGSQSRGHQRLSETDLVLQPSQVEEMLAQQLSNGGGGGGKDQARRSTSNSQTYSRTNSSTSTTESSAQMEEQVNQHSRSHSSPLTPRRSSLWDGFMMCLSPVVGLLKKEKRPMEKKDKWEIPFADIRELNFIGSGSQGAVFVGEYLSEKVAVKKMKDVAYCQEARHLRKLSHPNIVKFKGVCTEPPCFCLVLEYCPGGTLYDYIRLDIEILPPQVVGWARQIGSGMLYLHSKKIIHRDLKSLNILLCNNDVLKISDFGVSRHFGEKSMKMTFVGTVGWMSPEMIRHELCSEKVDIWSYGVLLWEMLMQEKPYNNVSSSAVIWGVGSNSLHLPIPSGCPVGLKVLLEMCWQPKPKNRPSFRQILMHLDLVAGAFLTIPPDTYLMSQESWRGEIEECLSKLRIEGIPPNDSELIQQREEELKHAQDVRVMYEQKLQTADKLYKELKSCKSQLDAKELELTRRERQLNDTTYKMKRQSAGGGFPHHTALDCGTTDSSDNEEDGTFQPHVPTIKSYDSPGGRKRVWRQKRKSSQSKEDKAKESSRFLDRVQNSDLLARRESLPPLSSLMTTTHAPHHLSKHNPSTHSLLDEPAVLDTFSRDSTPRPRHPTTPLAPDGSFSPEVTELIESVRHPRGHRRNGSNGSLRTHKRQGSSGSTASSKGVFADIMPLRPQSRSSTNLNNTPVRPQCGTNLSSSRVSTAHSSKRGSLEHTPSRRGSGSGIPYSKMDSSDSESSSYKESNISTSVGIGSGLQDSVANHSTGEDSSGNMGSKSSIEDKKSSPKATSHQGLYSNESSMDTHGSDGDGHDADGESTSDGYENRFDRFSGTEPNETTESNIESSVASPSQAESDELTSCSTPDITESDITSSLIPKIHSSRTDYKNVTVMSTTVSSHPPPPTNERGSPGTTHKTDLFVSGNMLTYAPQIVHSNSWQELTPPSNTHSKVQVSSMVSQFENSGPQSTEPTSSTSLTIPVHIRRVQSPERKDDSGSVTPTITKPKINSMTAIVRSFFENMSKKSKSSGNHLQHSAELEDSGFQSPQAGVLNEPFPLFC